MTKQLNEDGQELVDGEPVSTYEGKFINAFEMEFNDAVGLSAGDVVTITTTVLIETPKFTNIKKSGTLKRQHPFRVIKYSVLDPDKAKKLLDEPSNTEVISSKLGQDIALGFDPKDLEK
jgi:hypothetical protein